MKSAKQIMEKKIMSANREYAEKRGNGYCLFRSGKLYEIAQRPLWHLVDGSFDSIVFNEIVMDLETTNYYDACAKAYCAGYRGVINSCVEDLRENDER